MTEDEREPAPVTFERYQHVSGPFYHGTTARLDVGDELRPGYGSNFQHGRVSNNIYFTALSGHRRLGSRARRRPGRERPTRPDLRGGALGAFRDDPNVTDKRARGNPTRSYRSRHAFTVLVEVADWRGHEPDTVQAMLDSLDQLRQQGRDIIED